MTAYYVRSGAAGAGTGADWANAYTTLAAAFSGKAAGDVFYVSEDHAETQASAITLTPPGTIANPTQVICVNHSGTVPPVSADLRATATITTTGTSAINFAGSTGAWYKGIIFNCSTGAGSPTMSVGSTASGLFIFEDCSLRLVATGAAGSISLGNGAFNGIYIELRNTTASFAATGQGIRLQSSVIFRWMNTASALLGTIPTTLIDWISARAGDIILRGVDLSAAGSGKTIIGNTASGNCRAQLIDCKLNASVTKFATPTTPALEMDAYRSGSSGVNYNVNSTQYAGSLDEELTIVRTGGASDGTTPLAWKIVTSANTTWFTPFESPWIPVWNDTTGSSVTATLQCIWGGGAVPFDDEIWLEIQELGDASSPLASFVNDSKADVLAAHAGQTAGSGTWGGSTTKFELSKAFTAQQKGWIYVRVKAAKASSTFYIDPKVTLT